MSAPLFLYGTLRHPPLLETVLGAPAGDAGAVPAALHDHAVCRVEDEPFPMLLEEPGARAEGLLLERLSAEGRARLDFYEGGFDFARRQVTVETGQGPRRAEVYACPPGRWTPGAPFRLDAWAARWGALSVAAAEEVMIHREQRDADSVAAMFPMIRARAQARLNALEAPAPDRAPQGFGADTVRETARRIPYARFYSVEERDLSYPRFEGGYGPVVTRAALMGTDAAIVLPYDPVSDRVMLLEQFRPAPYFRGDPRPWCLEPVAGRVDGGETPEQAALREGAEEAGLSFDRLEFVSRNYPSPGSTTEYFHVYVGICRLPERVEGTGGLDDEAEDIRRHVMPFETAMALAEAAELDVGPLLLALYWLARHRARLRTQA